MELVLDHVAIAVPSIAAAQRTFELLTGGTAGARERVAAQGVELVFIGSGTGRLELLEPTHPDTPVGRFLERRGPGLHHVAYRVRDLDAVLASLAESGIELIDHTARPGAGGHRVAFIHPRASGGVLLELVEHEAAD